MKKIFIVVSAIAILAAGVIAPAFNVSAKNVFPFQGVGADRLDNENPNDFYYLVPDRFIGGVGSGLYIYVSCDLYDFATSTSAPLSYTFDFANSEVVDAFSLVDNTSFNLQLWEVETGVLHDTGFLLWDNSTLSLAYEKITTGYADMRYSFNNVKVVGFSWGSWHLHFEFTGMVNYDEVNYYMNSYEFKSLLYGFAYNPEQVAGLLADEYNRGYQYGLNIGSNGGSLGGFVPSLLAGAAAFLFTIMNFEIMGFSIGSFFFISLTIMIIGTMWRVFKGGD